MTLDALIVLNHQYCFAMMSSSANLISIREMRIDLLIPFNISTYIYELELPALILRDIVISVETTSSQAEERGHSLLDEMHILPVHGLLHLLGFDHEISDEAEAEMEKEEELLLNA
ncbi:Endoribonuclease YbeY [Capsicum annuum]|nr:Endoribonuclease YbeY [Capsicum annuum]